MNPKANLVGLLIPLNPLYPTCGWVVTMENGQLIAYLHLHRIFHFNHYANPAKGLVKDRGSSPFIPNDHRHFGRIWRKASPVTAFREVDGLRW